jgi:hypothetical protein
MCCLSIGQYMYAMGCSSCCTSQGLTGGSAHLQLYI